MSLLWNMINEYCDIFRKVLQGKYNNKRIDFLEGEGGTKLKYYTKNYWKNLLKIIKLQLDILMKILTML